MQDLLGLRLKDALRLLEARGVTPTVVTAQAPRNPREDGTLRVIRVRGTELTVGAFRDGNPSDE
ncbi:MAG: hypothetical protein J1E43_12550 [Christensenellaceae bacterium]|nr:hypothetical protein [Christensenellaceae bacterium]